jgi:hypothetical protein
MPEWLAYANFVLNLLFIPLLSVLWNIKTSVTMLQSEGAGMRERIIELRSDLHDVRSQFLSSTQATAAAANAAAVAIASAATAAAMAAAQAATAAAAVAAKLKEV